MASKIDLTSEHKGLLVSLQPTGVTLKDVLSWVQPQPLLIQNLWTLQALHVIIMNIKI